MLRKIRTVLAAIFWVAITLLFLDFTGTIHAWLGWMAKIQFIPAVMAMNFVTVAVTILVTLLFGRIYCSVICPLGVTQDIVSWLRGKFKKKKRFRFGFKKENSWLRYGVLAIFVLAMVFGAGSLAAIIAPYSAYGRIVNSLFAPVYQWGNNLLALIDNHFGHYAFYSKEVWLRSLPTFIIAAVTLIVIVAFAWVDGRSWCNNVCPVGTILGTISRYSLFGPKIDKDKCVNCGLCAKGCKSSCIDIKNHDIDMSRCVDCYDCIGNCSKKAISVGFRYKKSSGNISTAKTAAQSSSNSATAKATTQAAPTATKAATPTATKATTPTADNGRRAFMATGALLAGTAMLKAQEFGGDGGLATVIAKKKPQRETRLVPPGAVGIKHMDEHCTACLLCVSACPNNVLRPSSSLMTLMKPEMSFEKGWCRPECTKCSEVCPAGAILRISKEEKTAIHIGHAVIDTDACITGKGENCGNCARHCPVGAIRLTKSESDPGGPRIPYVNTDKCIGCGSCEYVCPVRPLSAIHIEGNEVHHDERKEI